jgi:hypothetical protein
LRTLARTPIRVQNGLLDGCAFDLGQRQSIGKNCN